MPNRDRDRVGSDEIKIQYRNGNFAMQIPGYPPLTYTVDSQGFIDKIKLPPGMQLLRRGQLQMDDGKTILNPYPDVDTLAFTNSKGLLELAPLSPGTNLAMIKASDTPADRLGILGGDLSGIEYLPGSNRTQLDPARSDVFERVSRGVYRVFDMDTQTAVQISAPPRIAGVPDQSHRGDPSRSR